MKKLLMLVSVAMLAACGGGGSTSVSGVASKGLLRDSTVRAFLLQGDGSVAPAPVATTQTNGQGEYSLRGLPTHAHLVIEVSGTPGGRSTMLDESTGNPEAIDPSFRLSAIVHTGSSGEFTAHITPFSHMAYARTRVLGLQAGQIGASLSQARQQIEQQMGVSLDEKPVFAADGVTPQSESAKRLLGVAQMVHINPCQCPQTSVGGKTQCLIDRLDQDAATQDKDLSSWGRAISAAWMAASNTGGTAAVTETKQAVAGPLSTGGATASDPGIGTLLPSTSTTPPTPGSELAGSPSPISTVAATITDRMIPKNDLTLIATPSTNPRAVSDAVTAPLSSAQPVFPVDTLNVVQICPPVTVSK